MPVQMQGKVQVQTQVAAPKVTTHAAAPQKVPVQAQTPQKHVAVVVVAKKETKAQAKKLAKKTAKKKMKKKLHLARQFNQLVKKVDSVLDVAMKKLKKGKKLFHKAVEDGHKKQVVLQSKANGARRHAKGDNVKIEAIATHMALAQRAGARAFIKFVNTFRAGAKKNFRADYKTAKIHERQLKKIFRKICHHVSHAWKAMKTHGKKLHAAYMAKLKDYWKAKYTQLDEKGKPIPKATLKKSRHYAKLKMKHARSQQWHFKRSMSKAHHHAKKLRKGLKQAIRKIHFVFKKARSMYRHTAKTFMVGFEMEVAAQKPVSQKPLRKLRKRRQLKQKLHKKHVHGHRQKHSAKKLAKKKVSAHQEYQHGKHKRARLDSAEKKAVKIVKRAILQQQRAAQLTTRPVRAPHHAASKHHTRHHLETQHPHEDLAEENEDEEEDVLVQVLLEH